MSIVVFSLIANIAVATFVIQERTVYSWDDRAYWHRAKVATRAAGRLLHIHRLDVAGGDPRDHRPAAQVTHPQGHQDSKPSALARALAGLFRSIWFEDYNLVAALPLLPWTLVFGAGRLSFVLATLNIYAIPAAVLIALFCCRIDGAVRVTDRPWRIWVPLALVASFPLFWAPIVRGMLDVSVLVLNLLVLLVYFAKRPTELGWRALITIGLVLALSVIFRRWNAYWVVSFLMVIGIEGLIGFVACSQRTPANLVRHLRPSLVAGGSALATLGLLAGPFVVRVATTNYADMYEAFRVHSSLLGELLASGRVSGGIWVFILVLAAGFLISIKESRRLALFLTGQIIIILVLFLRTQSFAPHHYYLLQAGWLIMSSLLVLSLLERLTSRRSKAAIAAGVLASSVVVNAATFAPPAAPLHAWLQPVLPRDTYYPLVRHDVAELNRLYAQLDELLRAAGPQSKFYVLSATYALNDTHFIWSSIEPPFDFASSDQLLRLQFVDKRDGFPRGLLAADFVVLGAPPGVSRDGTQVLLEPARLMREGVGLGRAFEALPEVFHLDDGVTARIFRKVRPIRPAEVQALSDFLRQRYPDRPFIFDPDYGSESNEAATRPAMPQLAPAERLAGSKERL